MLLAEVSCIAQVHLEPANGANGIPGPITNSFIIKWASFDSILYYEYIMSDNPLCFEGCPGDTRQNTTPDTTTTEYNLQEGKIYYWITRMHYVNGDTSFWSVIPSSFIANWTEEEKDEIIKISPNPCLNKKVVLKVDWGVNPDAKEITISLYSVLGIKKRESVIEKNNTRYQDYEFSVPTLAQGTYFAVFILDDNPNNPNNRITKKIIIQ
jgi:hypothetical protein